MFTILFAGIIAWLAILFDFDPNSIFVFPVLIAGLMCDLVMTVASLRLLRRRY